MRAISDRLLIDTVTHAPITKGSRGKTYGPDAELSNVCVQSKSIKSVVDGNPIITAGALMFWDVTHSTAATFGIGDKITYTDKMTGASVERYIVDGLPAQTESLHHVELTLV